MAAHETSQRNGDVVLDGRFVLNEAKQAVRSFFRPLGFVVRTATGSMDAGQPETNRRQSRPRVSR